MQPECFRYVSSCNVMDTVELGNGLQLHDYTILDEEIDTVGIRNGEPSVFDGERHLPQERETAAPELMGQTRFICGLQQARPQRPVHRQRRTDDGMRNLVRTHSAPSA